MLPYSTPKSPSIQTTYRIQHAHDRLLRESHAFSVVMGRGPKATGVGERVYLQLVSCFTATVVTFDVCIWVRSTNAMGMLRALGTIGRSSRRDVQNTVLPDLPEPTGAGQQDCICPVSSSTATEAATRPDSRSTA